MRVGYRKWRVYEYLSFFSFENDERINDSAPCRPLILALGAGARNGLLPPHIPSPGCAAAVAFGSQPGRPAMENSQRSSGAQVCRTSPTHVVVDVLGIDVWTTYRVLNNTMLAWVDF